jgi:membrane protein
MSDKILTFPLLRNIILKTLQNWWRHDPMTNAAATSYYAIFSLPGLMIIILGFATLFVEESVIKGEVLEHITNILGADAAASIQNITEQTKQNNRDLLAIIIGFIALFFAATGLFVQLQKSFNKVWEVDIKKSTGFLKFIKNRLLSFSIIVVIGFLLLVSLTITALLNYLSDWLSTYVPSELLSMMKWIDFSISFAIITFLFSLMFKTMPDVYVKWKYAIWGGMVSTIFFNLGEYGINYYFKMAEPASAFGAAGSIILLMLWVSYSCLILLMGAEFSKVSMETIEGRKAKAKDIAKKVREKN